MSLKIKNAMGPVGAPFPPMDAMDLAAQMLSLLPTAQQAALLDAVLLMLRDSFATNQLPAAVAPNINTPSQATLRAGDLARQADSARVMTRAVSPSGPTDGSRLFQAIVGAESGGRNIDNRDSGAIGIGQVMPSNVRAWSREVLGYELTPEQFRQRPDLQRQIVQAKLDQYFQEGLRATGGNEAEAVRYAAAKWYSGNGELRNNTRPQFTNGNQYPSIASYADGILARYRRG